MYHSRKRQSDTNNEYKVKTEINYNNLKEVIVSNQAELQKKEVVIIINKDTEYKNIVTILNIISESNIRRYKLVKA